MASDSWIRCKIGDVFTLAPGYAFKSSDFLSVGTPVIKIKNVKAGEVVLDDLSFVDEQFVQTKGAFLTQKGDILITLSGNRFDGSKETWVGKVAQFRHDGAYLLNQRVGILRPKQQTSVDRRCCAYIMSSDEYQRLFIAIATSSGGQANLSSSQVLNAEILLPPLPQQRAIAAILGSLDDKIECNRRTNRTLEAVARAVFRSWFVDFDPVRARADGRAPAGLGVATAALFPDHFEDSELGKIPAGWSVQPIGAVSQNPRCGCDPSEVEGQMAYIGLEHMPRGSIELAEWENAREVESNKFKFQAGDILFGKLRPYFHKVGVAAIDGVCSTDILVLQPKSPAWFGFVLGHASSKELIDFVDAASTGTKMPRTNWHDLSKFRVVLPPANVAEAFSDLVRPLIARIRSSIHESRSLAALRDALLPRLISGELRVPDAERLAGRAP